MGVLSKQLFDERTDIGCDIFHKWTTSCLEANFSPYYASNMVIGSAKFLSRIYLLKMFLSLGKKDIRTIIKNTLVSEMRSTMFAAGTGILFLASVCFFRMLFGRIYYPTLLFLPGCVSGISLLIESRSNQVLHTLLYFNLLLETLLKQSGSSQKFQTVMFMAVSGFLMYFLTNRNDKIDFTHFWFYTPPKKDDNCENNDIICSHEKSCLAFIYEGFWKYFILGFGANIIKKLFSKMAVLLKKPPYLTRICFNKSNIRFGFFIGSYVGLNRLISCYLPKTKIEKKSHGFIAGLLSGLTYATSPNPQVLAIAITTLLQVIYDKMSKRLKISNHYWQRLLVFMLCHGYLMHHKFCYPKYCAPYFNKMIDACSNNLRTIWRIIVNILQ